MGAYGIGDLNIPRQFFLEVEQGNISGWTHNRKFGKIFGATTTLAPVAAGAVYQTPTSAQSLEIISSSTNDTSAGTGARTVTITGLDANWVEQSVTVTMNGTSAVAVTGTWLRVYRMRVTTSGTYGSASASSHAGTITLRNSGAGVTWALLYVDGGFGIGQSLIGAYTVPAGYEAYVFTSYVSVESSKVVSGYFFIRENSDTVSAPFSPIRAQSSYEFVGGINYIDVDMPIGKYPAKTDFGFMCKTAASTANISVVFDIYLKAV